MRAPLLLVAVLLLAGCGTAELEPVEIARPAEPQRAELDWRESYPSSGQRLVFVVDSLEITKQGWSADIAVTNSTTIPFELGAGRDHLAFGLMLFANDNLDEFKAAADNGRLPAPRLATRFDPAPPDVLAPNQTWRTTMSAPGSLADGVLRPRLVRAVSGQGRPARGHGARSWSGSRTGRTGSELGDAVTSAVRRPAAKEEQWTTRARH